MHFIAWESAIYNDKVLNTQKMIAEQEDPPCQGREAAAD